MGLRLWPADLVYGGAATASELSYWLTWLRTSQDAHPWVDSVFPFVGTETGNPSLVTVLGPWDLLSGLETITVTQTFGAINDVTDADVQACLIRLRYLPGIPAWNNADGALKAVDDATPALTGGDVTVTFDTTDLADVGMDLSPGDLLGVRFVLFGQPWDGTHWPTQFQVLFGEGTISAVDLAFSAGPAVLLASVAPVTTESFVSAHLGITVGEVSGFQFVPAPAYMQIDVSEVSSSTIEGNDSPAELTITVGEVDAEDDNSKALSFTGNEVSDDASLFMDAHGGSSTITYPPAPAPGVTGGLQVVARHSTIFEAEAPTVVDGIAQGWSYDHSDDDLFFTHGIKVWSTVQSDATDITYFRGVPSEINGYEKTDPFGDAIATIVIPSCGLYDGPWDDPATKLVPSETWFLRENVNVDFYIYPCTTEQWHEGEELIWHPLSGKKTLYVHELYEDGTPVRPKWEGFSYAPTPSATGWSLSCKGALWQLDNYQAKPMFPLAPKPIEQMIYRYFDPARRGLWTKALIIDLDRWSKTWTEEDETTYRNDGGDRFIPTGLYIGGPWLGFATRNMGSWSKALTGYVQGMLGLLYADPSWGEDITNGDQWTIRHDRGRQPVLTLRRQEAPITAVAWTGQHGVDVELARDASAAYNVQFFSGKDVSAVGWENINPISKSTGGNIVRAQVPMYPPAGVDSLYIGDASEITGVDQYGNPIGNNLYENYDGYYAIREREHGQWVVESYFQMPDGVSQEDGFKLAEQWVIKNRDAGWQGTITVKCDLLDMDGNVVSRYDIEPGSVLYLAGFLGAWEPIGGINRFHVARVQVDWKNHSVELTVDTKFRDLLSIEMAIAQGRDSLAPINALRVGQRQSQIEDLAAPWDDSIGAGCVPRQSSSNVFRGTFPYDNPVTGTTKPGNRPKDIFSGVYVNLNADPDWGPASSNRYIDETARLLDKASGKALYLPVCAGSNEPRKRWGILDDIVFSAQGQAMRSEFAAYDKDGNVAPVEMYVGFYYQNGITVDGMPTDRTDPNIPLNQSHSALWDGAFEPVDKTTNRPWNDGGLHVPSWASPVGWGTFERPGGYSPGTNSDGGAPTGQIIDGAPWTWDMQQNPVWNDVSQSTDNSPTRAAVSLSVAVYCRLPILTAQQLDIIGKTQEQYEHDYHWVYVRGRIYRQIQIGSGA